MFGEQKALAILQKKTSVKPEILLISTVFYKGTR